ncbi:MAG: flagellar brake domain-containing protein [Desulfitobacteriaceae bacterium]|nr:flagellar brake domain-containing protein [Desulfitobacteriaceae bacterium]MDI6878865.1 flagellar brake domain-containing protein [Desulfitobacteriaceae bacterium]MDI6914514.1 flagellar brake domain-containing protein [Desulfitobacteriaceae bacterium]
MSYKKILKPGLSVELVVSEGDYAGRYRTRVDEVGQRLMSVEAPFIERQVIPLAEGMVVEITFWDDISAYSFDAKILQRIAVPVPLFVLEFSDEVHKVQRRNFVRVPAFYAITFRRVTREGLSDMKKANMLDLSGGGMRFRAKESVENQALLYTQLFLPTGEIQTPARICRVDKTEDEKAYIISVEFYEISERERDKIIRCVFDLQRAMRKKGLV